MATPNRIVEFRYVLQEERSLPPEEQTTWILKTLTFREREQVLKTHISSDGDQASMPHEPMTVARRLLNFGLLGWENFRSTDTGEDVPFQVVEENRMRRVPDHILDLIAPHATELANAIEEGAKISEETAKNSG